MVAKTQRVTIEDDQVYKRIFLVNIRSHAVYLEAIYLEEFNKSYIKHNTSRVRLVVHKISLVSKRLSVL